MALGVTSCVTPPPERGQVSQSETSNEAQVKENSKATFQNLVNAVDKVGIQQLVGPSATKKEREAFVKKEWGSVSPYVNVDFENVDERYTEESFKEYALVMLGMMLSPKNKDFFSEGKVPLSKSMKPASVEFQPITMDGSGEKVPETSYSNIIMRNSKGGIVAVTPAIIDFSDDGSKIDLNEMLGFMDIPESDLTTLKQEMLDAVKIVNLDLYGRDYADPAKYASEITNELFNPEETQKKFKFLGNHQMTLNYLGHGDYSIVGKVLNIDDDVSLVFESREGNTKEIGSDAFNYQNSTNSSLLYELFIEFEPYNAVKETREKLVNGQYPVLLSAEGKLNSDKNSYDVIVDGKTYPFAIASE